MIVMTVERSSVRLSAAASMLNCSLDAVQLQVHVQVLEPVVRMRPARILLRQWEQVWPHELISLGDSNRVQASLTLPGPDESTGTAHIEHNKKKLVESVSAGPIFFVVVPIRRPPCAVVKC